MIINRSMTTKTPTTKTAVKKPKTVTHKKTPVAKQISDTAVAAKKHPAVKHAEMTEIKPKPQIKIEKGRYVFATGRRKTSIANLRLFSGSGESLVNKKPVAKYFGYEYHVQELEKPFDLTGLGKEFYFTAHVSGGGTHSQVGAVKHALAIAISKSSEGTRAVLKKNGLLTRDDRKKERKKPGLKRARRSPQWAKR